VPLTEGKAMTARIQMPITGLIGKEVVWYYTEVTCSTMFDLRVGDVGNDILYIGIGTSGSVH